MLDEPRGKDYLLLDRGLILVLDDQVIDLRCHLDLGKPGDLSLVLWNLDVLCFFIVRYVLFLTLDDVVFPFHHSYIKSH